MGSNFPLMYWFVQNQRMNIEVSPDHRMKVSLNQRMNVSSEMMVEYGPMDKGSPTMYVSLNL